MGPDVVYDGTRSGFFLPDRRAFVKNVALGRTFSEGQTGAEESKRPTSR